MGWMQYTSTIIGDIAWPTVVLAAIFIFRNQIARKLSELKSLRSKYGEADFASTTSTVEQVLEVEKSRPRITVRSVIGERSGDRETKVIAPTPEIEPISEHSVLEESLTMSPGSLIEDPVWTAMEKYLPLDPRYTINEAGSRLDQSVLRLAEPFGVPTSSLFATQSLIRAGVLSGELGSAIVNLLRLRDRTQGSLEFPVSQRDARKFVSAARNLCSYLDGLPRGRSGAS